MMHLLLRILVGALAIAIAAYLVPYVTVDGYRTAIVVAVVLAIVNAILGRVLRFFSFPLNVLTLGLVSFVISILMIMLVDKLVVGFETGGFLSTAVFALILSLVNMVFGVDNGK